MRGQKEKKVQVTPGIFPIIVEEEAAIGGSNRLHSGYQYA